MADHWPWLQIGIRWVLVGALSAAIASSAVLITTRPKDRLARLSLGWAMLVLAIVLARLAVMSLPSDWVAVWGSRVQFTLSLLMVPLALRSLWLPSRPGTKRFVLGGLIALAVVPLMGSTFTSERVILRPDYFGAILPYAKPLPGALMMIPTAIATSVLLAKNPERSAAFDQVGLGRALPAAALVFVAAGTNDLLMTLGVTRSVLLADIAGCAIVLGFSQNLMRRSRLAYDELRRAYADREQAMRRGAVQMRTAERLATHGRLVERVLSRVREPLADMLVKLRDAQEGVRALEEHPPVPEISEMLSEATTAAKRVHRTIESLSEFSRGGESRVARVEVGTLLERALALVHNDLRHRAEVVRRFDGIHMVAADPDRLVQAFVNVLMNAAHSIPVDRTDGGLVTMSVERQDDWIRIAVRDNGAGISEEMLPVVFDPYVTTKIYDGGAGLGLAICHRVVTSAGGQVAVESSPAGTTVRIELPALGESH